MYHLRPRNKNISYLEGLTPKQNKRAKGNSKRKKKNSISNNNSNTLKRPICNTNKRNSKFPKYEKGENLSVDQFAANVSYYHNRKNMKRNAKKIFDIKETNPNKSKASKANKKSKKDIYDQKSRKKNIINKEYY